jgi:hypothetical protein
VGVEAAKPPAFGETPQSRPPRAAHKVPENV